MQPFSAFLSCAKHSGSINNILIRLSINSVQYRESNFAGVVPPAIAGSSAHATRQRIQIQMMIEDNVQ